MKTVTVFTAIALVGAVACDNATSPTGPLPRYEISPGGDPLTVTAVAAYPPGIDPSNPVVTVGELVGFQAIAGGGLPPFSYVWELGDGTITTNGAGLGYVYVTEGVFTVTVTVSDQGGSVVSDALTVTVLGGGPSPEELLAGAVAELIQAVGTMSDNDFVKPQRKNALLNKLDALVALINDLQYDEALSKLTDDIRPKLTLGNKHSWIVSGDVSAELTAVLDALAALGATYLVSVEIDIQPGTDPNTIALGSSQPIPVAILSGPEFDATWADPATVVFADVVAGEAGLFPTTEDVNGDGLPDLLVCVAASSLDFLAPGETEAVLTGETFDGTAFEGTDVIRVVE